MLHGIWGPGTMRLSKELENGEVTRLMLVDSSNQFLVIHGFIAVNIAEAWAEGICRIPVESKRDHGVHTGWFLD